MLKGTVTFNTVSCPELGSNYLVCVHCSTIYFAVDLNRITLSTKLNSFFHEAGDKTGQQLVGK